MLTHLTAANIRLRGPSDSGAGAEYRPAAHEVLRQYPLLSDGLGVRAIHEAIDTLTERTAETGWEERDIPLDGWWANITTAVERDDNAGLPNLVLSELSPHWVSERLASGAVDEVLAVAGLVQSARQVASRVHSAELSYTEDFAVAVPV